MTKGKEIGKSISNSAGNVFNPQRDTTLDLALGKQHAVDLRLVHYFVLGFCAGRLKPPELPRLRDRFSSAISSANTTASAHLSEQLPYLQWSVLQGCDG